MKASTRHIIYTADPSPERNRLGRARRALALAALEPRAGAGGGHASRHGVPVRRAAGGGGQNLLGTVSRIQVGDIGLILDGELFMKCTYISGVFNNVHLYQWCI